MTTVWLSIGLLGQAAFACRLLVQWMASEREKKSVVPVHFWFLSVAGSALLLTYAIYRHDPVFVLGQAGGMAIYFRNLLLLHREGRFRFRRG